MNRGGFGVDRIVYGLSAAIAAVAMAGMVSITMLDVLGRNFHAPLHGAGEMIRFLLSISFVAGLALVTRADGHIKVGLLYDFYSPAWRRIEGRVSRLGTIVAAGFITWMLTDQGLRLNRSGALTDYFGWPYAPIVFGLAALSLAMLLFSILNLFGGREKGK